ncbi:MAG: shikimate dehydrogenase [Aliidiomarina sp.]|uniref:shikimate dehydrogenase n=1 Tax=Aliidiomarina sp. TaxID=1872439 RepID=UPI0025C5C461|nr:shikimate dehydrogenase [Aliidiomarina sp.]MCH8501002.1 shikimate dehydrogenase [Aliidiomarina sp.]
MKLAVFGYPIEHSLSPQIHTAFAAQFGRRLEYQRILAAPEQFSQRLAEFVASGGVGANVTVPLKEQVLSFCTTLSERAEQAGAVNTLILREGRWLGDNTDGLGLVRDLLRLGVKLAGARILIIGAGGAVRGVLGPLLAAQAQVIHVVNRTVARAQQLADEFAGVTAGDYDSALQDEPWDLIIHASAASLYGELPPLSEKILHGAPFCYDMVYGAQPTVFLQWAQQSGCKVADGLGMLVEQAALSYQAWTGEQPQTELVLNELRRQLETG